MLYKLHYVRVALALPQVLQLLAHLLVADDLHRILLPRASVDALAADRECPIPQLGHAHVDVVVLKEGRVLQGI
jgi:hypothetical protein